MATFEREESPEVAVPDPLIQPATSTTSLLARLPQIAALDAPAAVPATVGRSQKKGKRKVKAVVIHWTGEYDPAQPNDYEEWKMELARRKYEETRPLLPETPSPLPEVISEPMNVARVPPPPANETQAQGKERSVSPVTDTPNLVADVDEPFLHVAEAIFGDNDDADSQLPYGINAVDATDASMDGHPLDEEEDIDGVPMDDADLFAAGEATSSSVVLLKVGLT